MANGDDKTLDLSQARDLNMVDRLCPLMSNIQCIGMNEHTGQPVNITTFARCRRDCAWNLQDVDNRCAALTLGLAAVENLKAAGEIAKATLAAITKDGEKP
jgi:hypothetical protein